MSNSRAESDGSVEQIETETNWMDKQIQQ